jgi:hypothetical protein
MNNFFKKNPKLKDQGFLQDYYEKLDTVLDNVAGLDQSRKMLSALKQDKIKQLAMPDAATINSISATEQAINHKIKNYIENNLSPKNKEKYISSRERQSLLLSASENAAKNIEKNQKKSLERVVDVIRKAGTAKGLTATAAGVAGLGAAAMYTKAVLPLAVTGGVLYAGGKALSSAQAKKLGASILNGIDKSIKGGKMSAEALQQLKADRAVILDLVQQQQEEQQGEEQK